MEFPGAFELYFQICSILFSGRALVTKFMTLVKSWLNLLSGGRVDFADSVRCALKQMLTFDVYGYGGQGSVNIVLSAPQRAYDVGVSAKSGVSGYIFLMIPNVYCISIWSP